MKIERHIYSFVCKIFRGTHKIIDKIIVKIKFRGNGVVYSNFRTRGIPYVSVSKLAGKMRIGNDFAMNNYFYGSPIGCYAPCCFVVGDGAQLLIGHHSGMSQTAIVCRKSVTIGNYVKIGGGTHIYDTDFHSVNWRDRIEMEVDQWNAKNAPVVIGDNVFIGSNSIILKGVHIGDRSIVAAGSIVVKDIPADELWGGNPAKFIKKLS